MFTGVSYDQVDYVHLLLVGEWHLYTTDKVEFGLPWAKRTVVRSVGVAQCGPFLLVRVVHQDGEILEMAHRGEALVATKKKRYGPTTTWDKDEPEAE